MALRALTLPDWAFVPFEPEPFQVADDLLLTGGDVPRRIGVVDPQQHPVAQLPIRDGAEGVADVERTGRARSKTHSFHLRASLESTPVEAALLSWFDVHARDLPWRHTRDPYAILVSEIMLQQTQVDRVVPRYLEWLERWPTAAALAEAIASDGWPADLTSLPGVGPYTAAAIRNFAFGDDVLPHDVNVDRVERRTGHGFSGGAAQALMDLGATVCLARVPRCDACPLATDCPSRGIRDEPLRKQSRFEGSFRQRRADTLRLVAAAERPLRELDSAAVESLARDGLVRID